MAARRWCLRESRRAGTARAGEVLAGAGVWSPGFRVPSSGLEAAAFAAGVSKHFCNDLLCWEVGESALSSAGDDGCLEELEAGSVDSGAGAEGVSGGTPKTALGTSAPPIGAAAEA